VHANIGGPTDKRELAPMALEVKHLLDLKQLDIFKREAERLLAVYFPLPLQYKIKTLLWMQSPLINSHKL
jgi:hypothetical protein